MCVCQVGVTANSSNPPYTALQRFKRGRSQWYSTKTKDQKTVDQSDKKKLWLLAIPVTTFCLGTWQVFRLQWKVKLVEELEKKTRQAPVNLPSE